MKNLLFIFFLILLFSCGKKTSNERPVTTEDASVPPYDTIAVDSFSNGATSVDVVRKIRMASQQFQDSLNQVKLKNEEEKILQKSKDKIPEKSYLCRFAFLNFNFTICYRD